MRLLKEANPEFTWDFINDWVFTDDTVLLISAIGGYLGMVMIEEIPNTTWEIDFAKTSVDHNRPCIRKNGKRQYGPIRLVDVIARKIVAGKPLELDKTINVWKS